MQSEKGLFRQRLVDAYAILRNNRWMILGVTVVVVAVTAVATSFVTPVYESEATLLMEEQGGGGLDLVSGLAALNGMPAISGIGGSSSGQHMSILSSRNMVETVVSSEALQVSVTEPVVPRDDIFESILVAPDAPSAEYEVARSTDGAYRIRAVDGGTETPVTPGQETSVPGVRFTLNPALASAGPELVRFSVLPFRTTVDEVRRNLTVSQPQRDTPLMRIHYRSEDPYTAALVPNRIVELFIEQQQDTARVTAGEYREFLGEQVREYERQLLAVEASIESFQESSDFVSPETQTEELVMTLVDMQVGRDSLQRQQQTLQTFLNAVARRSTGEGFSVTEYRELSAYPFFVSDLTANRTVDNIIALEREKAELLIRRTPTSTEVRAIESRIQDLELRLQSLAAEQVRSLQARIDAYDASLAELDDRVRTIPSHQLELARLMRQQALLEQIYILVETKFKEQEMQQLTEERPDTRLLDMALVPGGPVAPRPMMNVIIAAVFGLVLGGGLAMGRTYLDPTVRSKRDAQGILPGVPFLGYVPKFENGVHAPKRIAGARRLIGAGVSSNGGDPDYSGPMPFGSDDPVSEAYRTLRTNLTRAAGSSGHRTLVITSAGPGEGKSFSAAYLALSLAHQGTRTLLIEADLRRPGLHDLLKLPPKPGLAELVQGDAELEDVVQRISTTDFGVPLDVILAGGRPQQPAELLASASMREFLASVRTTYDIILLDAPPVNVVSDAAVLATYADSAVLVARAGVTQQADLWAAASQLDQLATQLAGIIITGADPDVILHAAYD